MPCKVRTRVGPQRHAHPAYPAHVAPYSQHSLPLLRLAISDTFEEYTKRTKMSGMWLLQQDRTKGVSRWIWAAVLFKLFLLSIYLSLQLWFKFYSYPILNTIADNIIITDVAFPGITVCSPKVVNKERVQRFIKQLKIPDEYNVQDVAAGFEFIDAFTALNWVQPNHTIYKLTDEVLKLNNVSIYDAAMQVSAGCEDFVKRCFWGTMEFPCRQQHTYLSFMPTTSYLGPCCSFNYNPKNLSFIPFAANIYGTDGGLTFVGVEGSERNLSTGLIVLVHHASDFVTEASSAVTITPKSESFVEILPTVRSSSAEVIELSEQKRDCLISDDVELYSYRQAACLLACQTEAIFKTCNCYPYNLPTISKNYKECKLNDTECYSRNYDNFKSVKCRQCLPNCYDVTYSTLSYKADLLQHNVSVRNIYKDIDPNRNDTFIVRVHLAKQVVPSIRKVTIMSWIGLLSDLGGVFNLCMGLSLVSIIELFYYCTFRLCVNLKTRRILLQPLQIK